MNCLHFWRDPRRPKWNYRWWPRTICFQRVWEVRNRHMMSGLPSQYIFMLVCCYQPGCHHALCKKKSRLVSPPTWYHGGPPVTKLPPPKVDPHSHYICGLVDVTDKRALSSITLPPSSILKKEFSKAQPSNAQHHVIQKAAQMALLPPDDTRIWSKIWILLSRIANVELQRQL